MGTCETNPVGLLSAGTCRLSNTWSHESEPYGKIGGTYPSAYAWTLPSLERHRVETNERYNDETEAQSPCHDEQQSEDGYPSMTSTISEEKASKRKMKRFRLTHNQTRYLMNEFTRQAHPDAAHRERLSREIPGLSPRQVQVWFQNRRAKLKRLSTDDRERVLKSRAVPENFDMAKALRWPYTNYSKTPVTTISTNGDNTSGRKDPPIIIESIKFTGEEYVTAPLNNLSSHGYYAPTPLSVPESNTDSDGTTPNPSITERKIPFMPWTYPQIPTPPLEQTVPFESRRSGESASPSTSLWSRVSSGNNTTHLSPAKLTPPTLNCGGITPLTPLSAKSFTDKSVMSSQLEERGPATGVISSTPHSASSEDQLVQPRPCFGLSSFDISYPQDSSPTMGFAAHSLAFEPNARFVELPYPVDPVRNVWDIGP
ncbi:predicted protein [Uncinocarpus reesii 1704]|uniref:Homeobox domain-containing protein n=1 Tax=Uncinocarpus reesii (strain UAMH 1704) TaxID=336963 RepID=C4JH62_UNCRE|nr:uncharacterized protein UREG_02635 [Uncinocarpus reesii 1704]EEP77786.1 predicted protein [Uncinocarpus reesii 1704]